MTLAALGGCSRNRSFRTALWPPLLKHRPSDAPLCPVKARNRRKSYLRDVPGARPCAPVRGVVDACRGWCLKAPWEREADAGGDHRRSAGVDGLDDFVGVDAL